MVGSPENATGTITTDAFGNVSTPQMRKAAIVSEQREKEKEEEQKGAKEGQAKEKLSAEKNSKSGKAAGKAHHIWAKVTPAELEALESAARVNSTTAASLGTGCWFIRVNLTG